MTRTKSTRIQHGHYVVDTGERGLTMLFGVVTTAGPRGFTVRWETGATSQCRHGSTRVLRAAEQDVDPEALVRLIEGGQS